jgi:hypothetical protein
MNSPQRQINWPKIRGNFSAMSKKLVAILSTQKLLQNKKDTDERNPTASSARTV